MAKLIVIIIIVALAGGGFFLWQTWQSAPASTYVSPEIESRLADLRKLRDLRFDTGVLRDSFFRSLESPAASAAPSAEAGRANPFLPF